MSLIHLFDPGVESELFGFFFDCVEIQPLAIIAKTNDNIIAFTTSRKSNGGNSRLIASEPLFLGLNPVMDGIADQVHKGVGKLFPNYPIQLNLLTFNNEPDSLTQP